MRARHVLAAAVAAAAVFAIAIPLSRANALPPPHFGQTLDVGLVSGTVVITPPNRAPFTLGGRDRNIPIGSLIDTTHGRIDLRAAPAPAPPTPGASAARIEDAELNGGAFEVSQAPGQPATDIRLVGGSRALCTAPPVQASAAALSHRVLRLLHASGTGRFQTTGRYAAATVRGTIWLTEDFCDGTLVRVTRGAVAVENLVTHRTVMVRAGESSFARAPIAIARP